MKKKYQSKNVYSDKSKTELKLIIPKYIFMGFWLLGTSRYFLFGIWDRRGQLVQFSCTVNGQTLLKATPPRSAFSVPWSWICRTTLGCFHTSPCSTVTETDGGLTASSIKEQSSEAKLLHHGLVGKHGIIKWGSASFLLPPFPSWDDQFSIEHISWELSV